MSLLERVGTLLRANVNDLIERAENPEKLARQLVLDMENQLLQVKTQVAIAIADQHLLDRKRKEHMETTEQWNRKAELAVQKRNDELARAAIERSLNHQQMAQAFAQQLEDQTAEVEMLRSAFLKLERKLKETQSLCEMLVARGRRAKTVGKAHAAKSLMGESATVRALERLKTSVQQQEAMNTAQLSLEEEPLEDRFNSLEREDQIERLLEELKSQRSLPA